MYLYGNRQLYLPWPPQATRHTVEPILFCVASTKVARAHTAVCYHRDTWLSCVTVAGQFAPKFTNVKSENFVSCRPRWPEQVQLSVTTEIHDLHVAVAGHFAPKIHQCKKWKFCIASTKVARASTAVCYHRDTWLSCVTVAGHFPPKFTNVKSENFVLDQPRWPEQV